MSIYQPTELSIQPVIINFNKPQIALKELNDQADQFIIQVDNDLLRLNQLISFYQQNPCQENLQSIKDSFVLLENKYPDRVVALFPEYLYAVHHVLYPAIRKQEKLLSQVDTFKSARTQEEFIDFVNDLAPDSFANFLRVIADKYSDETFLQETFDKLVQQDTKFAYLLDNYAIQYIGGNNGKVFQLTHLETGEEFIVRYGNRLNNPRDIEAQLVAQFKNSEPNPFPPLLAARQGSYIDKYGNVNVCFLEVMPLYSKNLANQQIKPKDAHECMRYSCEINLQLGEILKNMQEKGFMHADVKPDNILMEYDLQTQGYHLKLMDRKSILRAEQGVYDISLPENFWYERPWITEGTSAPELDTNAKINVDKVHAYALGINLFLTAIRPQTYQRIKEKFFARGAHDMQDILSLCAVDFPGEDGAALMNLILKATQYDPDYPVARPGVIEILKELQQIKQQMDNRLRESCELGIVELKKMIPMFTLEELQQEFISIIAEIEKELIHPQQFTLSNLEQFIYKSINDLLEQSLKEYVSSYFDNELKTNLDVSQVAKRIIADAPPFRSVQQVIDSARKIEYLCQQIPKLNACQLLIKSINKFDLDSETQDQLEFFEQSLKRSLYSVADMLIEESEKGLFDEVMSEVLAIKFQQSLSKQINLVQLAKFPDLQKEFFEVIAKAKPFKSEEQVTELLSNLLKFNTKIYQRAINVEKIREDEDISHKQNTSLGPKH